MKLDGLLYYSEALQCFILILNDPISDDRGNDFTHIGIETLVVSGETKEIEKFKALLNGDKIEYEIEF